MYYDVENRYFEFLESLVTPESKRYRKLLILLHQTPFKPLLPMDENRAKDGVYMRYIFAKRRNVPEGLIDEALVNGCSCLEMMVALARKLGEGVLLRVDEDSTIPEIFEVMLTSLGLRRMTDRFFDKNICSDCIERCFNRDFSPEGEGGLFYIPGIEKDLRNEEFWYHAMWYIAAMEKGE